LCERAALGAGRDAHTHSHSHNHSHSHSHSHNQAEQLAHNAALYGVSCTRFGDTETPNASESYQEVLLGSDFKSYWYDFLRAMQAEHVLGDQK